MPEASTFISTDVALRALRARIDLLSPVIDGLREGEPLRHGLRVYVAHYTTAIAHLGMGYSISEVSSSVALAALRARGISSEDFVALTDIVALLSGQRIPEGANLDV